MEIPEVFVVAGTNATSPPSDDEESSSYNVKWKGSGSCFPNIIMQKDPSIVLGPGQVHPKGYRLTSGRYGELKLDFHMTKGMLEVEVGEFILIFTMHVSIFICEIRNLLLSYFFDRKKTKR